MNLFTMPSHIQEAGIAGGEPDFDWDENNSKQFWDRQSEPLRSRILPLSPAGQIALSCALAEWVYWRFDQMSDYEGLAHFIKATWAGLIDSRYQREWVLPKDRELTGPVLRSFWIAAYLLDKVYMTLHRRGPASEYVVNLAFYVAHITDINPVYKAWLKEITGRLKDLSPVPEATRHYFSKTNHSETERQAFDFGNRLPRTALDLTSGFSPEHSAADKKAWLGWLAKAPEADKENPFLVSEELHL